MSARCKACLGEFLPGDRQLRRKPCPSCKGGYHAGCLKRHALLHREDPMRNWNHRTFDRSAR